MHTTLPFKSLQSIRLLKQCSGELHACLLIVTQTKLMLTESHNYILIMYANLRSPDAEERDAKRRKIEEAVKENIEQAQQKQKAYYYRKHGAGASYQVGGLVKLKDFNRKKRKGGCLDFRWKGPYTITASLGKGLYRLKEQNGDKVHIILVLKCVMICTACRVGR